MNPTRRTLLTATALLPVAGCATFENWLGMTPAQWATDLSLAAGWMPQIVAALKALGVKQATLDQITAWAATIKTDAAAVATATATVVVGTTSATYVQEAMQTLSAIAGVALPLLLPGGGGWSSSCRRSSGWCRNWRRRWA